MTVNESEGAVVQVWPECLMEITEAAPEKFMIKFSSDACAPCQKLQEFVDSGKLGNREEIHVFQVKVGETEVYNDLRRFFKFRTLPFCVVTNRSLECIETQAGFSERAVFEEFIRRHF